MNKCGSISAQNTKVHAFFSKSSKVFKLISFAVIDVIRTGHESFSRHRSKYLDETLILVDNDRRVQSERENRLRTTLLCTLTGLSHANVGTSPCLLAKKFTPPLSSRVFLTVVGGVALGVRRAALRTNNGSRVRNLHYSAGSLRVGSHLSPFATYAAKRGPA